MSGFTGKPQHFLTEEIANGDFYPVLLLGEFQRVYRIPAEYHVDTVKEVVWFAATEINTSLRESRQAWEADGLTSLDAVDGESENGEDRPVTQYKRAVYCKAKALLLREFASFSQRDTAENLAKSGEETLRFYAAESTKALRRLMGTYGNAGVALL